MWQDKLRNSNKDYGYKKGKIRKKYSNPFFAGKKKRKGPLGKFADAFFGGFAFKFKLIAGVCLLVLLASIWFFFFSSYFMIRNISATGEGRIPSENIMEIAWNYIRKDSFFLPQSNLILLNREKILKKIQEEYAFNQITVEKKYPSTLLINFREKDYAYLWLENGVYRYIDVEGYVIKEIGEEEARQMNYPLLENKSGKLIENDYIAFERAYLDSAVLIGNKISQWDKEMVIKRYVLDDDVKTVKADLANGPLIYFNMESDLDKQISKLRVLRDEKLKNDFFDKKYIDVRYGDNIYFN